jgi:hypothetical protein
MACIETKARMTIFHSKYCLHLPGGSEKVQHYWIMPRKDDILHPQQTPTYHQIYVTGWQAAMHKTGPSHSGAGLCADYRPRSTLYVSGNNSHSYLGHIAK